MKVTDEMVNAADSVLSRVRPGIPDETIRLAIAASLSASPTGVVKPLEEYERQEAICTDAALSQWERSLKRPDMQEKDRVRGAIEAYKRQALSFHMLPARIMSAIEPAGVGVETDKVKDAFNHGYVLACCTVANLHDEPGIAFDVLQELGITAKAVEAMGLCEYDAAGLRKIEEARSSSVYRAALKGDEQ